MDHRDVPWGDGSGSADPDVALGIKITEEVERLRVQRDARRRLDAEERGPVTVPPLLALRDRLALPRSPVRYRIDGWLPIDARAMLAAQFKAGKTTLIGNLIRSLVDGDPFLGHISVVPIDGAVALLDTEMSGQLDEWLAAQGIRNTHRVFVKALRGHLAALDLLDRPTRQALASELRSAGSKFLILDPLRPPLDALGLDEHKDAGRFLVAFDMLLAEAGITGAVVVQHMGHTGERARGDSRMRDWPDVEWRLVRQDDNPASPRFISAYGRDVDVPESALTYDRLTRHLTIGGGSRKDAAAARALDDVLAVLDVPRTKTGIEDEMEARGFSHARGDVRAAINLGIRSDQIHAKAGPRRAILCTRGVSPPNRPSPPAVRRQSGSESAKPPVLIQARRADTPAFNPATAFLSKGSAQ